MKQPLNLPPPPIGDTPTLPGEMCDFDDFEIENDETITKISVPYVAVVEEDCPF